MAKSNLAYTLNNFNYANRQLKPKIEKPHIGRVKKAKIKAIKPGIYIALMIAISIVLSFYIINIAKGAVITFKIEEVKKQLELQQSESIRLRSILETTHANATEIENYAKLKLNMRKQNINQVHYICRSKGNKSEITKNKSEKLKKNENFFDKLKNCLKSIGH